MLLMTTAEQLKLVLEDGRSQRKLILTRSFNDDGSFSKDIDLFDILLSLNAQVMALAQILQESQETGHPYRGPQ